MPNPDPCFSHLSHASREEVFGRLHKALNDLASFRQTKPLLESSRGQSHLAQVGALGIYERVVG